jgi:hypothetical protein
MWSTILGRKPAPGAHDVTVRDTAAVWLDPELLAQISCAELMESWLKGPCTAATSNG